ncbi:MAG: hypothetical protein OEZ06_06195 [Myxococcales bacterium]|nr:hypothetical protein [Myxococcales bacterium]
MTQDNDRHRTDTSRWSLVVHRVSQTSAEIWVGTLFTSMQRPLKARVRIADPAGAKRTFNIGRDQWLRPFPKTHRKNPSKPVSCTDKDGLQRFYALRKFTGLKPDTRYTVEFQRFTDFGGKLCWQTVNEARLETLPRRLPAQGQRPFTIALASCFYDNKDGGRAAAAYRALYDRGPLATRPHITCMTGDQVYLDIGFDSLSPVASELRDRVADDYARHWRSLGSIFTRGGTWMLPDDHEYWNDYPYYDLPIPTLFALKLPSVRKAWKQAAQDGVRNVQRSAVVETLELGNDLSVCFADVRSYRGKARGEHVMMHPDSFPKLLSWARGLRSPGVLVISQPLIVRQEGQERILVSFKEQYRQLLEALGHSGHDVVVLSGDVHFGRIASSELGPKGGRLIEIVSSPLSNLTGLPGFSTATPELKPKHFPPKAATPAGWTREPVRYSRDFTVGTKPAAFFSGYPAARTKEHFMTVSFTRTPAAGVRLSAQSWLVREPRGTKKLPAKGFTRAFTAKLA